MPTFPPLLADLLRRDPGRPLVTFYDDATGERVELSVATYANWVAKTSSLLGEELDAERGGTIRIDLPTHWLTPVFLGAAWNLGLHVVEDADPDIFVCGPEGVDRDHPSVLACSLRPLGARFTDPLPAGVRDFGAEVWSQPDAFEPWDPPSEGDRAAFGLTQGELFDGPGTRDRMLTAANPASPSGLTAFTEPLVGGGSTILVRNPDPASWRGKYDAERATRTDGGLV